MKVLNRPTVLLAAKTDGSVFYDKFGPLTQGLQCVEYGTERSNLSLRIVSAVRAATLTNSGLAARC